MARVKLRCIMGRPGLSREKVAIEKKVYSTK